MKHVARLIILVILPSGCDQPGRPDAAQKFVPPSKILDVAALYQKNCAGCHGKDGKLGPAPPLNDAVFLAIVPDEELTRVITSGRKSTSMPAFAKEKGGTLTAEQIQALVKGLRKQWGTSAARKDWPPYVLPGEKGDAKRGQAVFANACAECHGAEGKAGYPIHDPAFLALSSEQMLRRIVITGRTDLGMPDCLDPDGVGRPLTASEINDVVALMLSWKK